jgi:hypothetical protein
MADQWYYARNNQKHGPLTGQQLKRAAVTGQLQPTDMVWKEGMPKWVPASGVKGLFQPAQTAAAVPARAAVARQPSTDSHAVPQADTAAGAHDNEPSPRRSSRKAVWLVAAFGAGVCVVGMCVVGIVILAVSRFGTKATEGGHGQGEQAISQAGGSPKVVPTISEVDFSVGPNGKKVVKAERKRRVEYGFGSVHKGSPVPGLFTQHGPFILYYDDANTRKRREGNILAGKWHGKVMGWYDDGRQEYERYFEKGVPVGTHTGWDEGGKELWQLTYGPGSRPQMSKLTCEAAVLQVVFLHGARQYNFGGYLDQKGVMMGRLFDRDRDEIDLDVFKALVGEPDEKEGADWSDQKWSYQCKDGRIWMRVVNFAECPGGGRRTYVQLMGPDVFTNGSYPKARKSK